MNGGTIKNDVKTNWRWYLCALLFVATTVNYLDRQVLSLTWKDFIAPEFHWTDTDYGMITGWFSLFYAAVSLFAGTAIDRLGTKKGYLLAILIWSTGACLHAGCGWLTMEIEGLDSVEALHAVKQGSALALSISTISVYESGNFPSAIKVTAEYFPKKDRALSTAIFNSGASVGALAAPATIPFIAKAWGWESAFIIIGALGFIWVFFWLEWYEKPEKSKHVNAAELAYIHQDDEKEADETKTDEKTEKTIPLLKCLTWSLSLVSSSPTACGGSICSGPPLTSVMSITILRPQKRAPRSSSSCISSSRWSLSSVAICLSCLWRSVAWILTADVCWPCSSSPSCL